MPWKIEWSTITTILDRIESEVMAIEGVTWQYAKSGTPVAEIGQACSWALELNTDFAPPTTTEIEPGNYQIDQIRGAVTTNIVASTPASESAGTIYANYTPAETDWNIGDLVKVTFSGGYVRTDQTPTEVLTVNATAGNDYVEIDNTEDFMVGWLVRVYDDVNGSEWMTISAIPSANKIEFTGNLSANHTTANNAGITRAIRQDLSTAIFFTMLQNEAQSYKIIASGTLDTSSATVPADSTRTEGDDYFNGNLLMMKTGAVANQPKLIVDYTATTGVFTVDPEHPFTAATGLVEYIVVAAQGDLVPAANSTNNTTVMDVVGNKGDTETADDMSALATASVVAEIKRLLIRMSTDAFTATIQGSARVELDTMLGQLATYLSAAGAAWSVQVNNNTARTNLEQTLEDYFGVIGCDDTNTFGPSIGGATPATVEAAFTALGTAFGAEFDGSPDLYDVLVTGLDSSGTTSNEDGSALERLEQIQEVVNKGTGTAIDSNKSLVDALGHNGSSDLDTGIMGKLEDVIETGYDSSGITANEDGSVMERQEYIQAQLGYGSLTITEDTGGSTTLITASEITEGAGFWKGALVVSTSGDNEGQARPVVASTAGTLTVFPAFDNNVALNDTLILISAWRPDVWNQQDDVAVTFNVTNVAADVLDLSVAGYSYDLNSLRLKFADPGAQTITVTLYELINDAATAVDTFEVDGGGAGVGNWETYHSLMEMFGVPHISGNDIRIAAVASDAGPYACTGQYQYALARTS